MKNVIDMAYELVDSMFIATSKLTVYVQFFDSNNKLYKDSTLKNDKKSEEVVSEKKEDNISSFLIYKHCRIHSAHLAIPAKICYNEPNYARIKNPMVKGELLR